MQLITPRSGGPGAIEHLAPYTLAELQDALSRLSAFAMSDSVTLDSDLYRDTVRDLEVVGLFCKGLERAVRGQVAPMTVTLNHAAMEFTAGLAVAKALEAP